MPAGPVKGVGRLVCGLVLLCVILTPVVQLDLEGAQGWLEDYFLRLELREQELNEQVGTEMKVIIEEEYAAYIVDKAAELGMTCTARVTCREEEGLYLPEQIQVTGLTAQEQERLSLVLREELGVSLNRQIYHSGEGTA